MTISSTTSLNQYTATSGQTVFTYTFKIYDENDIKVIVTDTNNAESVKAINTDYTVSGVGDDNGGSVTFTTGVTLNYLVTLTRNEPLTQEINYVDGDDFPADAHEEGLDRSAIRDQALDNLVSRAIKFTQGSNISSISTELTLGEMKDKILYFDATTGEPMGIDYSDLVAGASDLNITVPTGHITTARLADSAVTNAKIKNESVTLPKIQDISTGKILGRASAGTGVIQQLNLLDEDDMSSNSNTALATQQSIKAYVDSNNVFTESFESSEITIVTGSNSYSSVAHGLSGQPKFFKAFIRCKTTEFSIPVGAEIDITNTEYSGTFATQAQVDATNMSFFQTNTPHVIRADTRAIAAVTPANWRLVLKAYY